MKLIEISRDKHINIDAICSVKVLTHSQTKTEDLGYGQKRTKKVGETSTIKIVTADGVEHLVDSNLFEAVHDLLFPIAS